MKTREINIKSKALDFLSRRDYGYHELYQKLQKYTEDLDEIVRILDDLQKKGFLSEERYVNSYIHSRQSKYSIKKIRYDLLQKKVDSNLIQQALEDNPIDEYEVAYNIWQRKFGKPAIDNKERMRQTRFLQSRGFSYEIIAKVISGKRY